MRLFFPLLLLLPALFSLRALHINFPLSPPLFLFRLPFLRIERALTPIRGGWVG